MNSVLRLSACLAFAVYTSCLIGCESSEATGPVSAVRQHRDNHEHESHDESHGHGAAESLADAVAKVERLSSMIKEAFAAGDIEKGHSPLHEIGHLLQALPDVAAEESLPSTQQQRLKEAVDSLMDSFGALDERLHGGGNDGKLHDEVAAQIEEAMAQLKAVCEGEHSP